jgi:hypothetical protein
MKKAFLLLAVLTLAALAACCRPGNPGTKKAGINQVASFEAVILESWQGDFPIKALGRLPENQSSNPAGYLRDAKTFAAIWEVLKPGEKLPDIEFSSQLVLFVRNTQFYNRVSIGRVSVTDGIAEVLATETMSAMPIENKAAMALAVVPRKGIRAVRSGERIIPIQAANANPQ